MKFTICLIRAFAAGGAHALGWRLVAEREARVQREIAQLKRMKGRYQELATSLSDELMNTNARADRLRHALTDTVENSQEVAEDIYNRLYGSDILHNGDMNEETPDN
ncbi:hypothetical protein CPHO_08520 [Corynebacterium phocae]|uniref:Uncharacterized protein n=1 Tax=Corynebacterium phocae TaxID=161895 RepID=A0A1L7D4S8_9CORY|nr:hypothetical protein [Corynebacterium phocae]APT92922.1 hypothetical protein CPHO_08520 [Corynebacterium phocae]KAA8723252.1 hypothetical protein F4V58_08020 [Corynebacterium phocae]